MAGEERVGVSIRILFRYIINNKIYREPLMCDCTKLIESVRRVSRDSQREKEYVWHASSSGKYDIYFVTTRRRCALTLRWTSIDTSSRRGNARYDQDVFRISQSSRSIASRWALRRTRSRSDASHLEPMSLLHAATIRSTRVGWHEASPRATVPYSDMHRRSSRLNSARRHDYRIVGIA